MSTFLVSLDENGLLVGRMRESERWPHLDRVFSGPHAFREGRWVLPATHLLLGEHPDDAARRVIGEQVEATARGLKLWRVLSFAEPMPSRGQDLHWDLCFVYDLELQVDHVPPWFSDLRRVPPADLSRKAFARGHGELLQELGVL